MKMNKHYIIAIILLSIVFPANSNAQFFREKEVPIYKMTIKHQDSIVEFSLYQEEKEIELKPDAWYYWYKANKIHRNKGDFYGSLLHGEYIVTGINNELLTKGFFEKGLKNGSWKSWYPDGQLKSASEWEKGKKEGKAAWYLTDTTIIRYYKANKEISKEHHTEEKGFSVKQIFGKKDTTHINEEDN